MVKQNHSWLFLSIFFPYEFLLHPLIEIGWQHPRRVYNVVFHIRLKDDKIWVEQDWTRKGIGHQLTEAGIPAEFIELGYQPPEMRPYVALKTAT